MKTIEQERAYFALKCVERVKTENKEVKEKYKRNAKRLPALLTSNGLASTLAFLKSKSETEILYKDVERWLKKREVVKSNKSALEYCLEVSSSQYRVITSEVFAFFQWLKRMAEVELREE